MRFGSRRPVRIRQCRRLLTNEINATSANLRPRIALIFDNYRSCFQSYRQVVDAKCTGLLRKAIADRPLRATKIVRATMDSMGPLLHLLPSLRIIHLVRDPRSVTLSRWTYSPSVCGMYSVRLRGKKSRLVAEASLYCHHVTADIRSRRELERKFPGRIMWMRYEDVEANLEQKFRDIYELLGEPIPTATLNEMQKMADGYRQKTNRTAKWQDVLSSTDERKIVNQCSEFFQLIGLSPEGSHLRSTTATHKRSSN